MFYRPEITKLGCLWYMTHKCNYRCSYCLDQVKTDPETNWNVKEGIEKFRQLKEEHGPLQIDFTGGEPSVHRAFFPLLKGLSQDGNVIFMGTNLSAGSRPLIENVENPDFCYMNASLHLETTGVVPFFQKVKRLHQAGFHVFCSGVAYPPLLSQTLAVKEFFRQELPEVPFGIHVFFGEYEGKPYPDSYSKSEISALTEVGIDIQDRIEKMTVPPDTVCRTGKDWFTISYAGEIVRCPAQLTLFGDYFPNFRLSEKALPCPIKECFCSCFHIFWEKDPSSRNENTQQKLRRDD